MSRKHLFFLRVLCNLFVVFLSCINLRAETDTETVNKIRRAWSERHDAIKSFHYVCTLEETKKCVHGPTDPFGKSEQPASPIYDETFRSTITFSFDKGKYAYRLEGEQWSEITRAKAPYLFRVAFDGSGNRTLLKQKPMMPTGSFDHRREPSRQLTNGLHLIPLCLTFDTANNLLLTDYDCDKMRIVQPDITRDGRTCIEVNLPRLHSKQWLGRQILDPSRAYLPVQFTEVFDGVTHSDVLIEYAKDDRIGWVVSGWNQRQLESELKSYNRMSVAVIKSELNTDLKKELFEVPFPVGAHVVEDMGKQKRYYVQEYDGKLKPIKEREYGHISPGTTL